MGDDPYHQALTRTLKAEAAQPSELELLHQDYPGLSVTSAWHGGNSGPGVVAYTATYQGHIIRGFTVGTLREKLRTLESPGGPEGPRATA